VEYPEVTVNMVSRSRGKQPAVNSNESDTESEGVYRHTRTQTSAVVPINYSALAQDIEVSESHSAVAIAGLELFHREGSLCIHDKYSRGDDQAL